jgi:ubiquinone/menaquinone biosynthesis C-methylase UbiE
MFDADLYIQRVLKSNTIREPVMRSVIHDLQLPEGTHGLDAGCGIGLQMPMLADAIGANGRVTGLDLMPQLLTYGENMAKRIGLSGQLTFQQGDVNDLPFEDNTFDWVWSADCIGYPASELTPLLNELIRVTKAGGGMNILAWSSQQILPGYPLLEARLNATCSAYIPFLKETSPGQNFMRALRSFHEAGLEQCQAQTFVGDIQAPLGNEQRNALLSLFEMLWDEPQPEVSAQDRAEYERLCKSSSKEFILELPDYYAFFTYTMFRGRVSK